MFGCCIRGISLLKLRKPVVHASIFRFEGQLTTFLPDSGPCYRCLYPDPPPPGMAPSCPSRWRTRSASWSAEVLKKPPPVAENAAEVKFGPSWGQLDGSKAPPQGGARSRALPEIPL